MVSVKDKMDYYLAVDIGASSGRCILGYRSDDGVELEEVYRFDNVPVQNGGALCWDTEHLFESILEGMRRCAQIGKIPQSVGVDTWGVDFVLLGSDGKALGDAVCYRDNRTEGMDAVVHGIISRSEHYQRTGVQKQIFNTIYQLMAVKTQTPGLLNDAHRLLFMPDYFHYRLSGVMASEYTIASTSGLINATTKDWDYDVIDRCGYPSRMFGALSQPGTVLGGLTEDVKREVGYDCSVVLPPSHDTASAFFAAGENCLNGERVRESDSFSSDSKIILSSGTWSLMGVNADSPILTEQANKAGFSNEGGVGGKIRFLKNIMGLWMIQSVRKELPGNPSFEKLIKMAQMSDYDDIIDVNDDAFFAPQSMIEAVNSMCRECGYAPPQSTGDTLMCIYRSLAHAYAKTAQELEVLLDRSFDGIIIVGGGNRDTLLNDLTAKECQIPVLTGPTEATATGNILCQLNTFKCPRS